MENILRDKNENVSTGHLVLPLKSDMDNSSALNLKENHNPRSLSEIAGDTSSKFQLDASTPKNSKKSSSFKDTSFNIDNNDSIYQENIRFNESSGLSFLTNGLNMLKLKTDETGSDDEEQFLSFNDQTRSTENLNEKHDDTLVLERNESDVKGPADDGNVNDVLKLVKQSKDEVFDIKEQNEPVEPIKQANDEIAIIKEKNEPVESIEEQSEPVELINYKIEPIVMDSEPVELIKDKFDKSCKEQLESKAKEQIGTVDEFIIHESKPIDKYKEHETTLERIVKELNDLSDNDVENKKDTLISEKEGLEEKMSEDAISEENAVFEDAEDIPELNNTNIIIDSPNNVSGNITQILNDLKTLDEMEFKGLPTNEQQNALINKTLDEMEFKGLSTNEQQNTLINKTLDEMEFKGLPTNEQQNALINKTLDEMEFKGLSTNEQQNALINKTLEEMEFKGLPTNEQQNALINKTLDEMEFKGLPMNEQHYANINKTLDEMQLKGLPMNTTFEEIECAVQNTSYSMHTTMPLNDLEQRDSQFSATFYKSSDHTEIAGARKSIGLENQQLTQIMEEAHHNSTFDKSRHFDANMMHSTFNETKPVDSPTFSNIDDLRINKTREMHGCEQNVNITQDMINIDMSLARPNIQNETVTMNSTFEGVKRNSINKNFMESLQPSLDIEFKMPSLPVSRKSSERNQNMNFGNEEFTNAVSYNFGDSDFDFLQNFGSNSSDQNFGRDSVLLKFDPLLAKPVPQITSNFEKLVEEDELTRETVLKDPIVECHSQDTRSVENSFSSAANESSQLIPLDTKDMSVEIMKDIASENEKQINNLDCEEIKLSSIDHHENQNNKLMELENKMRMEAEQREEVLLKRISEKDKQISKMSNVVKEYEKAIAELIAEKEQLVQSYEKKCSDLKNDSEMNAQHLTSLESTFSDLHAKYERTKQLALDLKEREESTLQDRKSLMDNLKMQEARYEKMKTHAMAQLEIANNKLAEMLRNHQAEVTKLKAQLKKEEISRASINEQLIQKSKENEELVKICDELIGNHGNSHAV